MGTICLIQDTSGMFAKLLIANRGEIACRVVKITKSTRLGGTGSNTGRVQPLFQSVRTEITLLYCGPLMLMRCR